MKALFTDEHQLVRETVARLAASSAVDVSPEFGATPTGLSGATIGDLAESGFTQIATGGGDGLGAIEVAVVCEELGRGLSAAPFIGTVVMPTALLAGTTGGARVIDDIAAGHPVGVALDGGLTDVVTLDHAGDGASTGGVAIDSAGATRALAVVDGSIALVPIGGPWFTGNDVTRACANVAAGGALDVLGRPGASRVPWTTLARVAICADMLGVMEAALDRAVEYASERRQFGRPVGSFQAIQHLCADQYVLVEASRSITYYAAWACDHLPAADAVAAARRAMAYVSSAARDVTESVIQIHGGIGITWESPVHLHLRRAMFDGSLLGPPAAWIRQEARRFAGPVRRIASRGSSSPTRSPESEQNHWRG